MNSCFKSRYLAASMEKKTFPSVSRPYKANKCLFPPPREPVTAVHLYKNAPVRFWRTGGGGFCTTATYDRASVPQGSDLEDGHWAEVLGMRRGRGTCGVEFCKGEKPLSRKASATPSLSRSHSKKATVATTDGPALVGELAEPNFEFQIQIQNGFVLLMPNS